MTKRIVFIGNCQMEVMRDLHDKFVGGVTGDKTFFLPSWTGLDDSGTALLQTADLLVNQVQSFSQALELPPGVAAVRTVSVPLVSASFLWPFGGAAHPLNADSPFLKGGPYPGELGDNFLNRLIRDAVSPDRALEQYQQHDLGGPAALDRRFELIVDQQRLRDQACDFSIAPEIERHFRTEALFLSPHHPGLRITRALAAQCLTRMGAPRHCVDMLVRDLARSQFPPTELPIHPTAARHFKLAYGNPETDYYWQGEGRFTWTQWVLRYMNYAWSPKLFEGWTTASSAPKAACALFSSVIEELPGSPLAHAGMAKALLALRQLDAALPYITQAVKLEPQDPEFAKIGAFIASGLRRHKEAEAFAKRAATYDAGSVGTFQLLAKIQEDSGNFKDAEESHRRSLALKPDDAALVTDLGTALSRVDQLDESLECYQRACDLAPHDPGPHFGASIVLARLGRNEEAIHEAEMALQLRPGVGAYYSHYGHLMLRAGRRADGVAAFTKALEIEPHNAGIHNLLADMMLRDQLSKQGLYHSVMAADSAPTVLIYQLRAAQLLARHMRVLEAIGIYRRAIALSPDERTLHAELAALYIRLDRLEEAASELKLALDPAASDVKPFADLSAVLMRMARFGEATQLVDKAAQQHPAEPQFRILQADVADAAAGRKLTAVDPTSIAIETSEIIPCQEFTAPACVRYTNFQEVNPTFGSHHIDYLYVDKKRWVPAVNLCRLPATACVAVPNGEEFIAIVGSTVVAEQIRRDWSDKNLTDAFATCTESTQLDGPTVLIGRYGIRTWGHWLGELLPKIVVVESRWPGRFRFMIPDRFMTDPVHTTAMESLAYYGIGADRLVLCPPKTMYACSELYVVTSTWSAERVFHPEVAALMRERGPRDREPAQGWLNAALLRRSTRTRNIQNIAAVEKILVAHGFAIVDIEKLNFRQQVDLFKNANAIVCVLGSGLTGLMFAPSGVKTLTLAPGEWGDLFFYSMFQERDAVFADVRGRTSALDRDGASTSGFTVPTEALLAGLAAIGLENGAPDEVRQTHWNLGSVPA